MWTTWLLRGMTAGSLLALLVLPAGCTWIFQFKARAAEKQEVRLPPPDTVPLFTDPARHEGAPGRDHGFGAALAAGHFSREGDGDGDLELAIGVPGAAGGAGKVVRILKTAAGQQVLDDVLPGTFPVPLGSGQFGAALAAGDFDADGFDDLAIGAPEHLTTGAVAVLYGGPVRRLVLVPPGNPEGRRQFGFALAAGDLDGDGAADLVIGEPGTDVPGAGDAARVWVVWGRPGGQPLAMNASTQIAIPPGDEQDSSTRFGQSLAVGNFVLRSDRSQPIMLDVAVGAPKFDRLDIGRRDVGRVYVFQPLLPDPRQDGFGLAVALQPGNGWEAYAKDFGHALAAGNFNGDRDGEDKDDLAIGAPLSSIPAQDGLDTTFGQPSGRAGAAGAGLVFLAPHGEAAVSAPLRVLSQDRMGISQKSDNFGWSLAAGDFNRDGVADLAIGSPNERMAAAFGLNGVSGAGAVYFRFGNGGDWDDLAEPGGIPQIPVACFDYIDAVRGAAAPRKNDRFGTVLLATFFDAGEAVDLIVGAPSTDVSSVDGVVKNAGVVWIGLNQETTPGPFDGEFVGDFRDDACGGGLAATMTMTVRHREEAVCGLLTSSRALCFGTEDEHALVEPINLPIIAGGLDDPGAMHLEFVVRDADDDKLGTLFVDAEVADADSDLTLDLRFVGRGQADGVERSVEDLVLERQ